MRRRLSRSLPSFRASSQPAQSSRLHLCLLTSRGPEASLVFPVSSLYLHPGPPTGSLDTENSGFLLDSSSSMLVSGQWVPSARRLFLCLSSCYHRAYIF